MTGLADHLRALAFALAGEGEPTRAMTLTQAADAITRLRGYARHDEVCAGYWWPQPCTCGLDALIADIEGEG